MARAPALITAPHATGGALAGAVRPAESRRVAARAGAGSELVSEGMRVKVEFKLTNDEDGTEMDSSEGKEPLEFICAEGEVFPGLDAGVVGMTVGETKKISLAGDAGFGERDEEKTAEVPLDKMPEGATEGGQLEVQGPRGPMMAYVKSIGETTALLDFNHPLAGQPLSMTVTLVSCEEVPENERLVVETVSAGDGKTYPKPGDSLTMHYTGTLAASGKVFDSSRERGDPFQFQVGVGQVIRGWDEGVPKMSLGERAMIKIPAAMGYGDRGAGDAIPPNADLVFDVELLKIN